MAASSLLNHALMCELYKKERRYYKVYTGFRPNVKSSAVTPKFYSKYEGVIIDEKDVNPEFLKLIDEYKTNTPRDKWDYPATTTQCYGWYSKLLVEQDVYDRRFNQHRILTDTIKLAAEIKGNLKKEPPSKGPPFKL